MNLGINLCFAVKRMPDPEAWAAFVRDDLGLGSVQLTFDLLDPWWSEPERGRVISRIRQAAERQDLSIHSACVGLAHYVPAGLLDPDPDARTMARTWWLRAIDVAADLGARAVGGPLGSMSADDATHPGHARARYEDLVESVAVLCQRAHNAGLEHFLIEPTPIVREIPSTIAQCAQLIADLDAAGIANAAYTLDIGHTVYEPLYGPDATVQEWITGLGRHIALVHLDNTDRHGDPHWGWPDPRGCVDVTEVGRHLADAGLAEVPVMLEVFPRFEDDDETVRKLIVSSVTHCRQALAAAATAPGA